MKQSFNAKPTHYQVNNDRTNEDESHRSRNPVRIDIKHENDRASYDKQSPGPDKDITKSFSSSFHLFSLTFQSKSLLKAVLGNHKNPAIAWSGGKDSTVLLHMVMKIMPNIKVIWVNTGVEFPECVHFIKKIQDSWKLNLYIAKPSTTFWDTTDKFGWPMLGKGGSGGWQSRANYLERNGRTKLAKATREAKISAACCRLLKHQPAERLYKELGVDCLLLGNMIAESRQRYLTWSQRGDYYYASSEGRYKVWPLASWTDEDVWKYHARYKLPHSEIYDKGHKRNGCWPCLMDFHYEDNKLSLLHKSHPKLWHFLVVDKGLGKRIIALKLALDKDGQSENVYENLDKYVDMLVERRPCYFDRL